MLQTRPTNLIQEIIYIYIYIYIVDMAMEMKLRINKYFQKFNKVSLSSIGLTRFILTDQYVGFP
jgi:hypothetical protein